MLIKRLKTREAIYNNLFLAGNLGMRSFQRAREMYFSFFPMVTTQANKKFHLNSYLVRDPYLQRIFLAFGTLPRPDLLDSFFMEIYLL